jgi:hypothetical protein
MKKILLTRLQTKFIKLVQEYLRKTDMSQGALAGIVGMQRSHLNALLHGHRPLSAYYLLKFTRKGIFAVKAIKDEKADSLREYDFWEMAEESENIDFLKRVAKLRKRGIDIVALAKQLDTDV